MSYLWLDTWIHIGECEWPATYEASRESVPSPVCWCPCDVRTCLCILLMNVGNCRLHYL